MVVLVLVGLPGSGKSVAGRALAERCDWRWVDTDQLSGTDDAARTLRELGEEQFRVLELERLMIALATFEVVSTGGGVVTTETARAVLSDQPCVWLRADHAHVLARVNGTDRPLLGDNPDAALRTLAAQRDGWYAEVSQRTVDANLPLDIVVDQLEQIAREWAT